MSPWDQPYFFKARESEIDRKFIKIFYRYPKNEKKCLVMTSVSNLTGYISQFLKSNNKALHNMNKFIQILILATTTIRKFAIVHKYSKRTDK